MRGFKLYAFAALAVLLTASSALAQSGGPPGTCVFTAQGAVAARFSGVDIQALPAASGGKGIYIQNIGNSAASTYGATIKSAAVLDANLATITPSFVFGNSALTSVIRTGTQPATTTTAFVITSPSVGSLPPIYIPPGKFVTVVHNTANQATNITVCFTEVR